VSVPVLQVDRLFFSGIDLNQIDPGHDAMVVLREVARNAMPMVVRCDGQTSGRVRNSWPKAGMRPASEVVCHPFFQNATQVRFR
jgi:hypothetical protein